MIDEQAPQRDMADLGDEHLDMVGVMLGMAGDQGSAFGWAW